MTHKHEKTERVFLLDGKRVAPFNGKERHWESWDAGITYVKHLDSGYEGAVTTEYFEHNAVETLSIHRIRDSRAAGKPELITVQTISVVRWAMHRNTSSETLEVALSDLDDLDGIRAHRVVLRDIPTYQLTAEVMAQLRNLEAI